MTSTIAGMFLNWTALLFLIALAALFAVYVAQYWPDPAFSQIFAGSLGLTVLTLVLYGGLIRSRPRPGNVGGTILGIASALTLFVGACWLLVVGHGLLKFPAITGLGWTTGIVAGASAAFPAIVRFIPVLQKPAVRTIALKIALVVAGLIIPIGAIALF